jgi:hypothetical protein
MLKRMLNTVMFGSLLMSAVAGYAGMKRAVPPAASAAPAAASCEERPAPRRHRIEPEGCFDPTVLAAR